VLLSPLLEVRYHHLEPEEDGMPKAYIVVEYIITDATKFEEYRAWSGLGSRLRACRLLTHL
jgi:hypothetical protein